MKHLYISILSVVILASCSNKETLPEEVLNKEEMVALIVDLEINQAIYKVKFANGDSINYQDLMSHTFQKLNTSSEQFNTSLAYYAKHPKDMEEIYSKAITKLTQDQAKIQRKKQQEKD